MMNSSSEERFCASVYDIRFITSFPAKIEEGKKTSDVCACLKPLKINVPQNVSAIEHSLFKNKTLISVKISSYHFIYKNVLSALISFMTPCLKHKLYDIVHHKILTTR